ncbi:hypothetical protein [Solirubrum puertoriconensis]|nr:hypothetical protein [Solirubrum puertoriconensis]
MHSTGNQSGHNRCHGYRYSRQNRTSHDPRHAHERGPERPDNSWDTL